MTRIGMVTGIALFHGPAFGALLHHQRDREAWAAAGFWEPGVDPIEGVEITGLYDPNREAAEKLASVLPGAWVADEPEDLLGRVDGILIADDGTQQHQKYAERFLRAGIPTFIDKPLSRDWREAASILALAEELGTPCMSSSALRYAREVDEAWEQIEAIAPIKLAVAVGPNELIYYGIHPAELMHRVLGPGVLSVHNVGRERLNVVRLAYADGRIGVLCVSEEIGYVFELRLYGEKGSVTVTVNDGAAFYRNMLAAAIGMVRTGVPPIPYSSTLEIIKTLDGAKRSLASGLPVELPLME